MQHSPALRSSSIAARLRRARAPSFQALKAHPLAWEAVALLAVSALANRYLAKKAERDNPPVGRFISIGDVRLHYVEQGTGTPLMHGNGSMIQDFRSSGLIEMAARDFRVIVFDRPGYGYSSRPRGTIWTPQAQADLVKEAMAQLGITNAIVLGHSWGTLVAAALAVRHPKAVRALILMSGYYYPTPRPDVLLLSIPAFPILGYLISYTIAPLISRLMWPLLMRNIFGPCDVPQKFSGFPKELAVRPSQLRASAAEAALMIPGAATLEHKYQGLQMPVTVLAGERDRVVNPNQSARLHRGLPHSNFRTLPGIGHMVHQSATDDVMAAIREDLDIAA